MILYIKMGESMGLGLLYFMIDQENVFFMLML